MPSTGRGNHDYRPPSSGSAELLQSLRNNQHFVTIISAEELDRMVRDAPPGKREKVQQMWTQLREHLEFGANWYSTGSDTRMLVQLVAELGIGVNQLYVRHYAGRAHIILRGYAGNRSVLTGTRYAATHPRLITLGIGRAAVQHAVRSGGILTIQLVTAYRVVDYLLTDTYTLTQLVGRLATDVVKVGAVVGVSLAVEAGLAMVPWVASVAALPLAVVILAGFGTAMTLDYLDKQYGLTDRLIKELDSMEHAARENAASVAQSAKLAVGSALSEYMRAQTGRLMWVPRY